MKNRLTHLNDHLFQALERLNDESLNGEDLQNEIAHSKAVSDLSGKVIDLAKTALEGEKLKAEYGLGKIEKLPPQFNTEPAIPPLEAKC